MNKHFTRNEIINNLAKYELYYQVTLGNLISLTNTKEIDYEVEFQLALGSIYELLKDLKTLDDMSISFDDELRKQAAMDSVQNFANVNLEILKSGEIKIEKWEKIITQDLAKAILASILELEKENE